MDASFRESSVGETGETEICGVPIQHVNLVGAQEWIVGASGRSPATYVVTPNAAHLVGAAENPDIRLLYQQAGLRINDSRVVARLCRMLLGSSLPVAPGSDLACRLLEDARVALVPVYIIGMQEAAFAKLARMYPDLHFKHHNPPMGFIHSRSEVDQCLRFLCQSEEPKIAIFAVGAPQQEMLAFHWASLTNSAGVGICLGASLDFIVGEQQRAPEFIQHAGLEWLFRLALNPQRLWKRYLLDSPKLFFYMMRGSKFLG